MSLPPTFPLLRLPFLAANQVLLNFDVGDIIHFSSLSKRITRILKTMRLPMKSVGLQICKGGTQISMMLNSEEVQHWFIDCLRFAHKCEETPVTMHFRDTGIKSFSKNGSIYSYAEKNNREYVRYAIELITDVFRSSITSVDLFTDETPESRRPLLDGVTKCEYLNISGKTALEVDELRSILQNCSFRKLRFSIPMPHYFTLPLENWDRLDYFANVNYYSAWITGETLMALRADCIFIHQCRLTMSDCQQFMERWLNSTNDSFSMLLIHWTKGIPEAMSYNNLGFQLQDLPKARNHLYRNSMFKYNVTGGKDMVRADGVVATVHIRPKFFFFGVWE
ncbi:unnamed protein product [Caenorhabditis brenneri]